MIGLLRNWPAHARRGIAAIGLILAMAAPAAAEELRCPQLANTPNVLPSPIEVAGGEARVFRRVGDTALRLHIFRPDAAGARRNLPAVVMFFGGGWMNGTVDQLAPVARHVAARGAIAILADYRTWCRNGADVAAQVSDANAAMAWVRRHAGEIGVDPKRIAALGGSSGGHLAASTALFGETIAGISSRPDVLLLFYPCVDLTNPWELDYSAKPIGSHGRDLSPLFHIDRRLPLTFLFQGEKDPLYAENQRFCAEANRIGASCTWREFAGAGHGFFNPAAPGARMAEGLEALDEALVAAGFLDRAS